MTPERLKRIQSVLNARQADLTVLADEVHKGRNIAAIMRTCDAVGIDSVHCVYPRDGYRPYRGTALGTQKWVNVELYKSLKDAASSLKSKGFQLVVTSLGEASVDYREVDYTKPTALVLGSEGDGVSDEASQLASVRVTIPMVGMVESYNVSVACAVILAEAQRQRQVKGMYENGPYLDEATYKARFFKWSQPKLAEYCDARGIDYPLVNELGDIVDGPNWYKQIRMEQAKSQA